MSDAKGFASDAAEIQGNVLAAQLVMNSEAFAALQEKLANSVGASLN